MNERSRAENEDDRDDGATRRAGDRAPDATDLTTVDGGRRFFDLLRGRRWTLLRFGAGPAFQAAGQDVRTLSVVADPAGPDELDDNAGHLARAYGAGRRTLVLIRPDGYIGVLSEVGNAATISDHLGSLT